MDNPENNPQNTNNSGSQSNTSPNNQSQPSLDHKDFVVSNNDTPDIDHKQGMSAENKAYSDSSHSVNKILDQNGKDQGSRMGMIITIVLIVIIIGGIWQSNKDREVNITNTDDEVNIIVDSNQETGSVTIVNGAEVVNQDIFAGIETIKIKAYYNKEGDNECENVALLERTVEKKYDSPVINTVRGLLTPLSSEELKAGYLSSIPEGTYLRSVGIENGVAKVVLSSALNNVAGSCRVMAIRSQIEKTLLQFSYIKSVDICIDANCNQDEILQP